MKLNMEMTFKPREPKFKGMTVKYVGYIDIADIEDRVITNVARKEGLIGAKVANFETLIISGEYLPWHNIPPTVIELANGKKKLNTGDHRLHAHKGQGKTKIWVAIVEFDSESTELYYQSIENKLELGYLATPRTPIDIVNSAMHILKAEGYVDGKLPTSQQLWTVVDKLDISTKEAKKVDIHEELKKKIGTTTKDVKGYSAATAALEAAKIHGNSSIHMSVEMYKDVHGVSRDTDIRLFFKILAEKENEPSLPYWVYGYWSRMDGEKIPTARAKKPDYWKTIEENIVKFAKIIQSPDYVSPVLKHIPQLDGEFDE